MQSDPKVIQYLNAELKNELTAINQYFLHARLYKHWGFEGLGKHEYDESIEEMKHADKLIERIFMLDGLPNLQDLDKLLIGEDVLEVLQCDLKLEQSAQAKCREAIVYCESVKDFVSREILSIFWTTLKSISTGSRFRSASSIRSESQITSNRRCSHNKKRRRRLNARGALALHYDENNAPALTSSLCRPLP
jgi:bacterioferritin